MPINIDFNYNFTNSIVINDGLVTANPAIHQASRLYVIHNPATNRPVYVGTSANLRDRFILRLEIIREMGFSQVELNNIIVMEVQIQIDGVNRTPGEDGVAGGIDVEHLLIRTYIQNIGLNVRNIQKTAVFNNNTGEQINWTLNNNADIEGFGGPYNYNLANENSL
ncbi:hypothetical protein [Kordia sp.]|uniref:hypothetical protein n=1 Tax=Kordia sp. TaxID=1965332 RepID=UPI003D6B764A